MKAISTGRWLVLLAILDTGVFGGIIVRESLLRGGATVNLPVQGFDPRDLLSGHYLQIRLLAEREAAQLGAPVDTERYCLEEGADQRWHVARAWDEDAPCSQFLALATGSDRPLSFGVDRFYIDERKSERFARVTAGSNTYLVATIDPDGHVHAVDLIVNGESVGAPR